MLVVLKARDYYTAIIQVYIFMVIEYIIVGFENIICCFESCTTFEKHV